MGKQSIIILVITLILLTVTVSIMKPALHKQVMLEDADFANIEEPANNVAQEEETLPPPAPTINDAVKKQKTQPQQQATPAKQTPKQVKTPAPKPIIPKIKNEAPPKAEPPVKKVVSAPKPKTPHELTEAEEIIVWNKWRSDLQNQVMKDTKIAAPIGTGFKFSFTVDKFGNVSNLKVWSTSPAFNDVAVRSIKPVIQGYQRQPILYFPEGTKRIITNVTGGFRISTQTGYSSPSDYSDIERVGH